MSVEHVGPSDEETQVGPQQPNPDQRDTRPVGVVQEYERVKAPEELLSFMAQNIDYGFAGRNGKVYTHDDEAWEADFDQQYFLQSPEELLTSQHGVCWDGVELERDWFLKHGYQPETYFMMYAKEGGTKLPTHTFLVYQDGAKWRWFEHSFGDERGIHEYGSREELLNDVRSKHHGYAAQHRGATGEDLGRLRLSKYEPPKYGSSPKEFVANVIEHNPELIS